MHADWLFCESPPLQTYFSVLTQPEIFEMVDKVSDHWGRLWVSFLKKIIITVPNHRLGFVFSLKLLFLCKTYRIWQNFVNSYLHIKFKFVLLKQLSQFRKNIWHLVKLMNFMSITLHPCSVLYTKRFCCSSLNYFGMTSSFWWLILAVISKLKVRFVFV